MSALDRILESYRNAAETEREKGDYFENFALAFLRNDPVQVGQYSEVWKFADWAAARGETARDTGIDLVAKLRDEDGYAAIQCKFYAPKHSIQKKDIDSFLSASGGAPFVRRVLIETTEMDWSDNADDTIAKQDIPVSCIGLNDLRDSAIDWGIFEATEEIKLKKKTLYPHQQEIVEKIEADFATHDRGKLIMACGTGKTFTALKIAEKMAGKGGRVLFLVPSLALIAQAVREWTNDTDIELRSFAVCSDVQVGKRRKNANDIAEISAHELAFPATTDASKLTARAGTDDSVRMTVVFSTYQSISVITEAQKQGLPAFDLIICDEAHRTTGIKVGNEDGSLFTRIHYNEYVNGLKRLYMTATPRIYGDNARAQAAEASIKLCDMKDEALYGPTFFTRGFGWAVENKMLSDYRVVVLAVDEGIVSRSVQSRLTEDNALKLDDATKIVGCYKALMKKGKSDEFLNDPAPMRRAIAFCRDIRSSKLIEDEFNKVVKAFNHAESLEGNSDNDNPINYEVEHVDGTFNAKTRGELLRWLGDDVPDGACRILTNARCLSEGVDVPSLDAILFLHPRKSQIDVVQSIGRVMRGLKGKEYGYVILPVVIPAGTTPEEALNDNERYKVVWQTLNALRAHDDRFEAKINTLDPDSPGGPIEVIAIVDDLPQKPKGDKGIGIGEGSAGDFDDGTTTSLTPTGQQLDLTFDEFPSALRAKIVQKCGRRTYWEDWASDVGEIAQKHIERINATLDTGEEEQKLFDDFLKEIRDDLNDAVTKEEAVEMLAQHLITKPVFDALFEDYDFTAQNPVSQAMDKIVTALEKQNIAKEAETLEGFYASVKRRASVAKRAEDKQKIVVELYDKFFKTAFPKLTEKLGIVYTPIEIVDFIIHSVNDILQQEFGQTLGDEAVHILDPFTGTGTFITRLLQSGLIRQDQLEHKYEHDIHANEIVLLAYYIAAINIETAYHEVSGKDYKIFNGICLTDTFEMYESDDLIAHFMKDNSARRNRQKVLDIRVIIGNPPYNVSDIGVAYKDLNARIAETYAAGTKSNNKNSLYDSYIKAIRWASDQIKDSGVIGFVTNSGWLDGNAMDGMRKCLEKEFSSIYVFNLRGNARTSGEQRRKESGNVFEEGSRAPVAISILVKNKNASEQGKIYYHDIGDYLTREQKINKIVTYKSVINMAKKDAWEIIKPDEYGDWINKRDRSFENHLSIGNKKDKTDAVLFANYTNGVKTQRDVWCYNASPRALERNIKSTIAYYNGQVEAYKNAGNGANADEFYKDADKSISWSTALRGDLEKKRSLNFDEGQIIECEYRPFTKQMLYHGRRLNERLYQTPRIYPIDAGQNRTIGVEGVGASHFSVFMFGLMSDIQALFNGQHFPLKLYEKVEADKDLLDSDDVENGYRVKDGITDYGLKHFQTAYGNAKITKEDIFYYTYGLLHSEEYKTRFADNLTKELPRIPAVKKEADFWAFAEAGRKLGDLHVNYESAEKYPVLVAKGAQDDPVKFYRVEKMKFGGKGKNKDKSIVQYNNNITITNIPLDAYDYIVNGRSALEWVMERQCVKTDKKSNITNDANDYANEVMNNPAYPLELFQRIITVSIETMKIVRNLPKLEID